MADEAACHVCGAPTVLVGDRTSAFSGRTYQVRQCPVCWFSFVANPWTAYDQIYSEQYYEGRGADPTVDYGFEFRSPEAAVRQYEWRGLDSAVRSLVPVASGTRWLDFGCGNGGLVRYLRAAGCEGAFGYDTGSMAEVARRAGLPILTDESLASADGSFDVVTMVEVIEHVPEPLALLGRVRRLLKPGGLLFLTTGNAAPFRGRLLDWSYVRPDVHVSFFEPSTLARALEATGFRPEYSGWRPGHADIIRFKVLKAFGMRRTSVWERMLPWSLMARVVDARLSVSGHPIGWAR